MAHHVQKQIVSDVSTGFSRDFVTHVRGVGKAGGWEAGERRENNIIYIYMSYANRRVGAM